MERSPSESDGRAAGQEVPCLIWSSKFHCLVHKSPASVPFVVFHKTLFFFSRWGIVSLSPNFQAGGSPLVSCL